VKSVMTGTAECGM